MKATARSLAAVEVEMRRTWIKAALSLLLAASSSGCRVSRLFDLGRDVEVDESHGQSVGLVLSLDLAESATLRAAHPGDLAALSLDSAELTVTQVDTSSGSNDVQSVSGELRLRPDGAADSARDLVVGRFRGLQLRPGTTVHLPGTPETSALLFSAHNGNGRFKAAVDLDLEGGRAAHVVFWIALHASADYDVGP